MVPMRHGFTSAGHPQAAIAPDACHLSPMIKSTAARAGVNASVSAHWLRHAHGSHSLDRGATLAEVQATLGHANVATTSGYLHARPNTSSGLKLDEGIFR